jgi:hypothetical protein
MLPSVLCIIIISAQAALNISDGRGDSKHVMKLDMTEEHRVCHTIHVKNCTITMKKVLRPVMVKNCVTNKSEKCVAGEMKTCSKR